MEPRMEFADAPVEGALCGVIDSMVGYRMSGQSPSLHRGVPSPSLTFIVNLDTPIVAGTHAGAHDDGTAKPYDNILGGFHLHAAYLFEPDRQAGVQLAINPMHAREILGVPAAELDDIANDAASVLGDGLLRLRERVGNEPSWPARFDALRTYVRDRASAAPSFAAPRTEVAAAWRWMIERRGRGRMDDLSRYVYLSGRQLTKLFHAELGVTPKAVNRLIRFHYARYAIQEQSVAGCLSLTDVAHVTGYYDHAHLTREFRAFMGCSPTDWLAEEFQNIQAGGHHQAADLEP
ncbi:AraC family transcriptional regulator [Solicola gregarius]|uniref:Helix-turn-helix domain-containing protein n=1 Tax=Solicola gregarius TaxID=2908642 RepID=A0AA46TG04_9ACTN|nr:helix-turn-helix domain-containing protein [Solicola gregarius]UYM04174.1 helix-turn-helix domain-containing protein [Solicola gregarius]